MIELKADAAALRRIADQFGASEQDLRKAYSRALGKTSRALRTQARKDLRQGLKLRAAAVLNARLQIKRIKASKRGLGGAMLWAGTNDMAATSFKGRPRQGATGASVGDMQFPGAFVARGTGKKRKPGDYVEPDRPLMVFRRFTKKSNPIYAETGPISEDADPILIDVFVKASDIFFKNFTREVRAATIYNV